MLLCSLNSPGKNTGGLPCPPPRDLPDPGIESTFLTCPALADRFFTISTTCEALSKDSTQFSHSVMSNTGTPWTGACQASLSITNSWTLLKLMSTESVSQLIVQFRGTDTLVILPLFGKTLRTFPAPEIPIGLAKAFTVTESFLNCSVLLPLPSWVLRSWLFLRKLPASEFSTQSVVYQKPH